MKTSKLSKEFSTAKLFVSASSFVVFLLSLLSLSAATENGRTYRFAFIPPGDNVPFTVESKIIRKKTVGTQNRVDEINLLTDASIQAIEDGYVMRFITTSFSLKRNGVKTSDPLLSLTYGGDFVFVLDKNGGLVEVQGYEDIEETMRKTLPPQYYAALSGTLTPEVLQNRAMEDWFFGAEVLPKGEFAIGDVYFLTAETPMPDGNVVASLTVASVEGEVECGGRTCLRIEYESTSDLDDARQLFERTVGRLGEFEDAFPGGVKVPDVSVTADGVFVIDPDTMLVHERRQTKTINMQITDPNSGRKLSATGVNTVESVYRY